MFKRWLMLAATVVAAGLVGPATAAADPEWLMPQYLPGTEHRETRTAMLPDGTVVLAAVRDGAAGSREVVAAVRPPGGAFGPVQVIERVAPGGLVFLTRLSVSPTREVTLAYRNFSRSLLSTASLRADRTFSPPTDSPNNLHGGTPNTFGFDAAGTLYAVVRPRLGEVFGSVEVLGPDGARATEFLRMDGFSDIDSEVALAVGADGRYTMLYTAETPTAGSTCPTWRLYAVDGTATSLGAPVEVAARPPMSYPGDPTVPCRAQVIDGLSIASLPDGSQVAAFDESYRHPTESGGQGERRLALVARTGGAWSAPQRFTHRSGEAPETRFTLTAGTSVLTMHDSRDQINVVTARRADGTWSPLQRVGTADGVETRAGVFGLPDGTLQVVWSDASRNVLARTLNPDGTFGTAPRMMVADYHNAKFADEGMDVATDGNGNGVLAVVSKSGPDAPGLLGYVPFDGAAPVLSGLAVPSTGQPGLPLAFPATAHDVWSPAQLHWSFGDGTTGAGGLHTYAFAGRFLATATATDEAGNTSTTSGEVAIAPAPPAPPSPSPTLDTTAPRFTAKPRVTPSKPRHKKAASLSFALDEAAQVTARVQLRTKGIKRSAKAKCRKAPKVRPKGAKNCTLLVTKSTRRGAFKVGTGKLKLPASLKPGRYSITITAQDAAGNTAKATASFTVRKAAKKR